MYLTVAPSQTVRAFEVVTLSMLASDDDFYGFFDCIEVWRSRSTEGGPYVELTGQAWSGARLPAVGTDPVTGGPSGSNVNVAGLTLELLLNEQDLLGVTFTGANPLTKAQAAAQIQSQSLGRLRAWVDASARLVVETVEPGTGATLRVISSDAAAFLGLPLAEPDSFVFGREARVLTVPGQSVYTFNDRSGSSSYFYRTRFRNRMNSTVSEFSQPYTAEQIIGVDPANVVVGYLDLVDSAGRMLTGIEVSLRSPFEGKLIAGRLVAGQDLMKKTDARGHVEFTMMRGQTYVVSIAGTNIAKEIVAPADPAVSSFLLVDDTFGTQQDYFRARIPQIPTAERRSF